DHPIRCARAPGAPGGPASPPPLSNWPAGPGTPCAPPNPAGTPSSPAPSPANCGFLPEAFGYPLLTGVALVSTSSPIDQSPNTHGRPTRLGMVCLGRGRDVRLGDLLVDSVGEHVDPGCGLVLGVRAGRPGDLGGDQPRLARCLLTEVGRTRVERAGAGR